MDINDKTILTCSCYHHCYCYYYCNRYLKYHYFYDYDNNNDIIIMWRRTELMASGCGRRACWKSVYVYACGGDSASPSAVQFVGVAGVVVARGRGGDRVICTSLAILSERVEGG